MDAQRSSADFVGGSSIEFGTRLHACVVFDGPNICLSYPGHAKNKMKGLQVALDYFRAKTWPSSRLIVVFPETWKKQRLEPWCHNATLLVIPSVPGSQQDDLYAFLAAQERDAFLLTRDKFRNHVERWATLCGAAKATEMKRWCETPSVVILLFGR